MPSPETLADGTYPLAFPVNIHVSRASFTNALVRAFLWHLYDDTTLEQLEGAAFAGLDLDAMSKGERDAVFDMLAAYETSMPVEEESAPATETATPEAPPEATPEATPEDSGD